MILSFGDTATKDFFEGRQSAATIKALPSDLHRVARRKLDWLNMARSLNVLKSPPGNRLEALKGELLGYWSIRINRQYRIIFEWDSGNARRVKIIDYH